MSSYSCVVPVDWKTLWAEVVPAWLSVLDGSQAPASFYDRYVPEGIEYADEYLKDVLSAPADFLLQFPKDNLSPPYSRDALWQTGRSSSFLHKTDLHSFPFLLELAIKQTAAVDLPGDDPFPGDFYGSMRTGAGPRKIQIAGTKNSFHFLGWAFDISWQRELLRYIYSRKPAECSPPLHGLFEALFLYERVLPGAWFPDCSPTWPSHDDFSIAGYLSPDEVTLLRDELAQWSVSRDTEGTLYIHFVDRVTRAAQNGLGLITLHGGL